MTALIAANPVRNTNIQNFFIAFSFYTASSIRCIDLHPFLVHYRQDMVTLPSLARRKNQQCAENPSMGNMWFKPHESGCTSGARLLDARNSRANPLSLGPLTGLSREYYRLRLLLQEGQTNRKQETISSANAQLCMLAVKSIRPLL